MTQQRAVATGEYGRQPMAPNGEAPMAERVNAAMQSVKPPRFDSPFDRARAETGSEKLAAGDHTMLASGERRRAPFTLQPTLTSLPIRGCR